MPPIDIGDDGGGAVGRVSVSRLLWKGGLIRGSPYGLPGARKPFKLFVFLVKTAVSRLRFVVPKQQSKK